MPDTRQYFTRRADFVIEMYRVYWANITRTMEGVWKVLAPLTVVGTIIAGVHKDYLPALLGFSLAFTIIFWALNVIIDLNSWHRRNLFFLTKVEQQFLRKEDYGYLLPARYKRPKSDWITFYCINATVFVVLLVLVAVYAVACKLVGTGFVSHWLIPIAILLVGIILTWLNAWAQKESAQKHFQELFGKPTQENGTGGTNSTICG